MVSGASSPRKSNSASSLSAKKNSSVSSSSVYRKKLNAGNELAVSVWSDRSNTIVESLTPVISGFTELSLPKDWVSILIISTFSLDEITS